MEAARENRLGQVAGRKAADRLKAHYETGSGPAGVQAPKDSNATIAATTVPADKNAGALSSAVGAG